MKSKKKNIATMEFGMAVTGSAGVYAGSSMEKINAFLNHSIGFTLNGSAYTPVDSKGNAMAPITYRDTTYLPVRALADVLKVPLTFNQATNQVVIGTSSNTGSTINLEAIEYSAAQKQAIITAFSSFKDFETAYAPIQMVKGDTFQKVVASEDGVSFLFNHMRVVISPRDNSAGYASQEVQLSNGTKAKWYSPSTDSLMLSFNIDGRTVTISSPDQALSKAQMEKVAVSVASLNASTAINVEALEYNAAQKQAIIAAFGNFQGFETAYAPNQMIKGDVFQKVVASDDGVSFLFDHMRVVVSPRDFSAGYASQEVQLSNGTKAKWYSPSTDSLMLGFSLDDRTITISSPDQALNKAQMEKVAVSVAKLIK